MNKLVAALFAGLLMTSVSFAQAPAPAAAKAAPAAAAPAAAPAAAKAAAPAAAPAGDSCEAKAVGKNGKPLAGAAKTAFMKKCEADAKAGK